MKSEVYKRSMNTRYDLLALISDAVARIKERVIVSSNQRVISVYKMCHLNIKLKL